MWQLLQGACQDRVLSHAAVPGPSLDAPHSIRGLPLSSQPDPLQVFAQHQASWFLSPHPTPVLLSRAEALGKPGAGGLSWHQIIFRS